MGSRHDAARPAGRLGPLCPVRADLLVALPASRSKPGVWSAEPAPTRGGGTGETVFGGKTWRVMALPLADASGAEVGDLIVLDDISALKTAQSRLLTLAAGGALVVLAGLFGFLFVLLRRTDAGIRAQQAQLRRSEEHLSATLRSIGDGVIACDGEGQVDSLNGVAETLTGWTTAEAQGPSHRGDLPHRPREDPRRGGKPGGAGAARGRRRGTGRSHRADRPRRHGTPDRRQLRAHPRRGRRRHRGRAGLPRRDRGVSPARAVARERGPLRPVGRAERQPSPGKWTPRVSTPMSAMCPRPFGVTARTNWWAGCTSTTCIPKPDARRSRRPPWRSSSGRNRFRTSSTPCKPRMAARCGSPPTASPC